MMIEGLPETDDESVTDLIEDTIAGVIKSMPAKRRSDTEVLNSALFKAIRNEVNAFWGRKPNVSIFVHRV
jgi:ribonuclease J